MNRTALTLAATFGADCDGGDCNRRTVSLAYDEGIGGLIPVCRRHIAVYRVTGGLWQAEDEYAGLRYARRSRFRWLAQRRILRDQRAADRGITTRAQRERHQAPTPPTTESETP